MNPKYLLDMFDIAPKKSLGQNFLHDPNALEKIVSVADLQPDDTVLEIGPGTGALTVKLAQSAGRVVAVEIDERLIRPLRRQVGAFANVEIICANFLELDFEPLFGGREYKVVANLPYYITTLILRRLLEARHKPRRLVLTVQQEVAERMVAAPGDMSLLAVSVQFYGAARILTTFPPAVFWPRPEVASAVVRIDTYDQPPVEVQDEAQFFRVARAGFGQKRKQLKNALGAGLGLTHGDAMALLDSAGIDPTRRAETLSLSEWAALARALSGRQVYTDAPS